MINQSFYRLWWRNSLKTLITSSILVKFRTYLNRTSTNSSSLVAEQQLRNLVLQKGTETLSMTSVLTVSGNEIFCFTTFICFVSKLMLCTIFWTIWASFYFSMCLVCNMPCSLSFVWVWKCWPIRLDATAC